MATNEVYVGNTAIVFNQNNYHRKWILKAPKSPASCFVHLPRLRKGGEEKLIDVPAQGLRYKLKLKRNHHLSDFF